MLEAEMSRPAAWHQRATSSPSQLEGCCPPGGIVAALLADARSASQPKLPSSESIHPKEAEEDAGMEADKEKEERQSEEEDLEPTDAPVNGNDPPIHSGQPTDTRTHVVVELYEIEQSYVESMQFLVMKYLEPLKNSDVCQVEPTLVDAIFYKVPDILAHHQVFLEDLRKRIENWDLNQRIGDLFLDTFTKQSVIETYTEFVNNWKNAKETIKIMCQSKPAFARFLDNQAREHKRKLSLDSLLIMPVQRIPRYELLIQQLLKHTEACHADIGCLTAALKTVHDLAVSINLGCPDLPSQQARPLFQELARLEAMIDGLHLDYTQERWLISHEQVSLSTAHGRKDRALFLFSDLLIVTSVKRKSTTVRKTSGGQPGDIVNSLDGNKYKLLMKIPLEDVDIIKAKDDSVRKMLREMEQLTADVATLSQMAELAATLHCPHAQLEESVREMLGALNKQLIERHAADSQLSFLELTITTQNGTETIAVSFSKPEKRTAWEETFIEAKQRLERSGEYGTGGRWRVPELVCAVPIRKTRAGLQFTCAGAPPSGPVWVCNSDGYVGQVCVLSLNPEPTVTSCNGVCNARITCIAPVPGLGENNCMKDQSSSQGVSISVEDTDKSSSNIQLESSSSSSDEEEEDNQCVQAGADSPTGGGTMWLGTEDGSIHVYNSTDNIRTKRNKIKIHHSHQIHSIIYLDNKVFVSLGNGDVCIYFRDLLSGGWNTNNAMTVTVGNQSAPVSRMVPVHGRLWCVCHQTIKVFNTATYSIDETFTVSGDSGRAVSCIASGGNSVWLSLHNSAVVKLFHPVSCEWLAEVNVAPTVTKMLASCDDIIRQHKAACLRVTSLLACRDLLWIGTSAGVILTLPLPHVPANASSGGSNALSAPLAVSGVAHGHTGHVRFLTTVETGVTVAGRSGTLGRSPAHSQLSKLLVISGGDGYEDFRSSSSSEVAGREDSTNHLLLWYV